MFRLALKQALFAFHAPSIARQCASPPNDSMAWNDHGEAVRGAGIRDGTYCGGSAECLGKIGVCPRFSGGNFLELFPHFLAWALGAGAFCEGKYQERLQIANPLASGVAVWAPVRSAGSACWNLAPILRAAIRGKLSRLSWLVPEEDHHRASRPSFHSASPEACCCDRDPIRGDGPIHGHDPIRGDGGDARDNNDGGRGTGRSRGHAYLPGAHGRGAHASPRGRAALGVLPTPCARGPLPEPC